MPDHDPAAATVDDLFGLPVTQFVAARNVLARHLRSTGNIQEAASVSALRRPTLAAWAVNHVVRVHRSAYDDLVAAGAAAQRAQRRALSGVKEAGLRTSAAARRAQVEALTDLAATALAEAGARPESHLDDIAATFEAASADPNVADEVGRGRLSAPVRPDGDFSMGGFLAAMAPVAGHDEGDAAVTDEDDDAAALRRQAMRAVEAAASRADRSATVAQSALATARELGARARATAADADAARQAAARAQAEADEADVRAAATADRAATAEADAAAASSRAHADAEAVEQARAALDALADDD